MRFRLAALMLASALAGCSSHSQANGEEPAPATRSSNRYEMGEEDFAVARNQGIGNVYALVSRFRPEWLRPQISGNRQIAPTAWMDRTRLGSVAALANVPLASVVRVRYLSPSEAQGELGLDNLGGAIVALTR